MHGKNFIGYTLSSQGEVSFSHTNPANGQKLSGEFIGATREELDRACLLASQAFLTYRKVPGKKRAVFLRSIAAQIEATMEALIQRATLETALPAARIQGEIGRTIFQLNMFANLMEEGSWADARIDNAILYRTPLPKPDLRRMYLAIGPVAVFGASNFPLAFSTAGGDTAAALAAGCPVIVKAHRAHPGTGELVAEAIIHANKETGMPEGVFSMLHGNGHATGEALVKHPSIQAVGFTGSTAGGRQLMDLASSRPDPIPVYAEMGSTNPLFVLPRIAAQNTKELALGLSGSITLGVGQFCTNPGITVTLNDEASHAFISALAENLKNTPSGNMVHDKIKVGFDAHVRQKLNQPGVEVLARSEIATNRTESEANPILLRTHHDYYKKSPVLKEEMFGPANLNIVCDNKEKILQFARELEGQLTATIHGTEEDLEEYVELVEILETKAGRLIINGFPTGVEVCPSMTHGGPYPSTTYSHFTSVGTAAISRFVRPVSYQNFPQSLLPEELKDGNPLGIWRTVDGEFKH